MGEVNFLKAAVEILSEKLMIKSIRHLSGRLCVQTSPKCYGKENSQRMQRAAKNGIETIPNPSDERKNEKCSLSAFISFHLYQIIRLHQRWLFHFHFRESLAARFFFCLSEDSCR